MGRFRKSAKSADGEFSLQYIFLVSVAAIAAHLT